jgi:transcriptional regulator with XRE-family HTH domain
MNFQDLHELLRLELVRRIEQGAITGSRLASQAGFQQAHISNFLKKKRALSLEGLDRVLAAQNLSIDQILPLDLAAAARAEEAVADQLQNVPIVSPSTAIHDVKITGAAVIESVPVLRARLHENRTRPAPRRTQWERFVAVRVDAQQAAAMSPVLALGALAIIDRHYNSLAPYRANQPNLYAVRSGSMLMLRYVDFDERHLILRPFLREFPVQLIGLKESESPADYVVGRICMVVAEV